MVKYHTHNFVSGSHKIDIQHKHVNAIRAHDKELEKRYGKKNKANDKSKKYFDNFSKKGKIRGKIRTPEKISKKYHQIEVNENGVLLVNLTKIKKPLWVKLKSNGKIVEMLMESN